MTLARDRRRRSSQRPSLATRRPRLLLERLEDRQLLAGVPGVVLDLPSDPFLGEDFAFTATFDNVAVNPADVGYGPFVDLIFPVNGADGLAGTATPDGITFLSASYLGAPVVATVLTFPDDGGGMGFVEHPYAVDNMGQPLLVSGTAGDQLVVLQLPFGSFTPDQPAAAITVNASLSDLADVGTALTVRARGGFQFGCDPLNNPMTDPSILTPGSTLVDSGTWVDAAPTNPTLLRLTKTYLGPEDETATGPNFPRQYQITVDIADGQTVTDFDIVDALDNTMAFLSVDATTSVTPATVFTFPGGLPPVAAPANSNTLVVRASTVTGGPTDTDLQVVFSFFIPEFDADGNRVIPINGADPTITTDIASGVGNWTPLDPRDPATPGNAVGGPETHELQNKSIAIQKSFQVVGGGDPDPGTVVEFTLEFQVSDYYTFGDLLLDDVMSDGLDWLPAFNPTFQVTDQDGNTSGMFLLGTDLTHTVNVDGTETLAFDLSAAMTGAGAIDGILRGGLATATDGDDSSPAAAAVGTVVFRAVVSQNYDQLPPSSQPPISQGDLLTNDVEISGTVRDNASIGTIVGPAPDGREGDDSSASGGIPVGTLSKSIYAINGNTGVGLNPLVAPGDSITYSLQYTHPISTFVDFQLFDFLPLPVFQVLDPDADGVPGPAWTFLLDGNPNNPPAAGVVELGPNDTFFTISGSSAGPDFFSPPTIGVNPIGNELSFFYGDFNDPLNQTTTVNLLFTIVTSDDPFADGLFLTNQVRATERNSQLDTTTEDSIVQIQLGQPQLNLTKGVVATNGPVGTFTPAPAVAPPLSVTAPGTAGFRFAGGPVGSSYLAVTPLDSDLANIDAGDLVTFSIVVENTGSSRRGAFDVELRDTLPAGFRIPTLAESAAQLNLSVTDGTGDAITFNNLGSGLFDPLGGIELVDPGPTIEQLDGTNGGALDAYHPASGRNLLVLTYDLIADIAVNPREVLVNTATLFHYAGAPGGPNHQTEALEDEAQVTIVSPAIDKTITATNQAHTSGNRVAIGEIVTYEVEITIPEGTTSNVSLVDRLDSGLAFVGINSITASAGVTSDILGGFPAVAAGVTVTSVGGGAVNQGRELTLDFGSVTNADTNNNVAETIVVSYDVVVLNSTNNNRGNQRNNQADWRWEDDLGPQQVRDSAPNVTIVEPTLQVAKGALPTQVEAGDVVTYTIDIAHTGPSNADAFDVDLMDLIPADTSYVMGTLTHTGGLAPSLLQESGGTVTAAWNSFPDGSTSQIQFDVLILSTAVTGSTITNNADVTWTSLPGDVTTPQSGYNVLSTERTGDPTDPGGVANDYLATDPADVTVILPTVLNKVLVSTSELSTTGNDVTIGEVVRYRLQSTLVGGTNMGVRLVDRLPDGMVLLDVGQVTLSFTSDNPILAAPELLGANNGLVPPTFVLPAGRISGSQTITFDLGTLINLDFDGNQEFLTLEFNALVLNTGDTNDGDVKSNVYDLIVAGNLVDTSAPVDVTILEPAINDVEKTVLTIGGNSVTYQVLFSNSGTTTAFDTRLLDVLPAQLSLNVSSVSVTLLGGASGASTSNSTLTTVDVRIDQMPMGSQAIVTYTALLNVGGQTIPNTADVTYTSLPGTHGTPNNPTGSQTPGAAGSSDGERTGDGGVNDYRDLDSEQLGSLGDFVWNDVNGDGVQDGGEPGLDGVTVTLVWPGRNGIFGDGDDVTLTTATSGGGMYAFSGLPAGSYHVEVDVNTVPAGFINTYDLDGNRNSQTDVSLAAGQNRTDVDFGYAEWVTVGGIKWNDANGDGVQNGGEGPLAGVTIFVDVNDDGVFGPGEPSGVTGPTGAYEIAGLLPGTLTIREVPPVGYYQTFPANFGPHTVTLAPGEALSDLNFGNAAVQPIVINDFDDEFIVIHGPWEFYDVCIGHWNDDATVAQPGLGESVAQWVFTSLDPGFYRVSATWLENPLGATNTPFTVLGGPTSEFVRVNQIVSPATYPNSFEYGGSPWMDLSASYLILGDTLTVQISNDADGVVVADAIRIERIVNPEITVSQGATEIASGAGVVDYGMTGVGTPVTLTFTVENQGGSDLYLAEPITVPAGYTVVSSFGQTTLGPQQTTTFDVRLDAPQPGIYTGDIVIYNSDNDENPFRINVTGSVDAQIIDDGDFGFSTLGFWTNSIGNGYQNDVTFSASGSGNDVATWSFTGLAPATTYRIAATWTPDPNRATNAPFTISGGASPFSTTVNQQLAPDDFVESGTAWHDLAVVTVTGTSLQVQLTDVANGYVIADAIRLVPLNAPLIQVQVDASTVLDGLTSVDFGITLLNLPVQKTFTVTNNGTQPLTLVEPIAVPSGFLASAFGQTVLNPNQSTTFTVTLPATLVGSFSGQLSFATSDPLANPFNFTVQGQVFITPPPQIVDDGDAGFSSVGTWVPFGGSGYGNDGRYASAGSGSSVATWSFPLPAPGTYRVSVTWAAHPNRATNAPYSVNGGPATLVNQQATPNDFIEAGTAWEDLGNFVIAGSTLNLTLTNAANGFVIADAVRIERIASPEIRVTVDGHLLADDTGLLDLGTVVQGEPLSRQVKVTNIGTEYLVLDLITAEGGFVASHFGQYTLAPEASTTFTVSLDTSTAGTYAGWLSFGNNDPDESAFGFSLAAEVSDAPQVFVLDNGDPGFQLTGNWANHLTAGFQQDLLYSAAGLGQDTSTWTFNDLAPGGYRVAATWVPHSNRGSNVPYAVNGSAPVRVDQRVAPGSLSDQGAAWHVLGDFLTVGDRLVVTMTDAANGYVIADAVRVERIQDAEISVTDGGNPVWDDATTTTFGSTLVGSAVSKTFTVVNVGALPLTLTGPILVPPGFTASALGQSTLDAGQSTTFTVTLDAATVGGFSGQVSFTSNDADEGLFNFTVSGTVASAAPPQIIDDGAAGFSKTSGWTRFTGVGRESDGHYAAAGSGSIAATWTFTVPVAGDYLVSATWVPHPNRATNAPYRIYDGGAGPANLLSTTRVNQELTPTADFLDAGTAFQDLSVVSLSGTTLTVTLANDANQFVIADAIRIEFVQPLRAAMAETADHELDALTADQVVTLLPAAIARWQSLGVSGEQLRLLDDVAVKVVDLPGRMLGGRTSAGLMLDTNAAGWGWSVDSDDLMPQRMADQHTSISTLNRADGFDLLHVIAHELGHVLGYPDLDVDPLLNEQPLMAGTLALGRRAASFTWSHSEPAAWHLDQVAITQTTGVLLPADGWGDHRVWNADRHDDLRGPFGDRDLRSSRAGRPGEFGQLSRSDVDRAWREGRNDAWDFQGDKPWMVSSRKPEETLATPSELLDQVLRELWGQEET